MVLAVGGWLFAAHGLRVIAVYRAMGWAGIGSGLLLAGSFVMFILAITRTNVANAVVLQSAAPLASAVLGRIFLGERLAPPTLVAIVVAVAGVALMFASALGGGDLVGNTLALGVAILFGANIVVVRAARGVDLVPATVLAGVFAMPPRCRWPSSMHHRRWILDCWRRWAACSWASGCSCSCAAPHT